MKSGFLLTLVLASTATVGAAVARVDPPPPPPPSAEKLALAHQLILASGGEVQMRKRLSAIFTASGAVTADALPDSAKSLARQAVSEMQSYYVEILPQLIVIAEQAYAANLTEQEMRDYITWMNSDSGRAIREKNVAITTQVIMEEGPLIREMIPKFINKAIDRACQQTQCSAQDRTTIAAAIAKAMPKG